MFFDDDDGDFTPKGAAGGSKLASLFGMGGGAGDNESLTYTAPKQPKSKDESNGKADQKGSSPSLLYATAVHTFRFVNGQYIKQGKLGIAVLGDQRNADSKILLYVSQKQPVAAAKIHPNFSFTVQKNNYASFYDDQSQMWSVCFESSSAATEFGKMVGLAKFNCSPVGLLLQDLIIGDGQDVQKGDNVELQYTGHLYTNQSFGKMFESNKDSGKLYKMKVGKGKVIKGWEEGVPGMRKGGKRLLFIPPGLAYGSKGVGERIPANSTLIFEIDVTRAKFANPDPKYANMDPAPNESSAPIANEQPKSANPGGDKKPELPVISEAKSIDQTDSALARGESEKKELEAQEKNALLGVALEKDLRKGRTHSLSEQLSKSLEKSSGKADLLARMSKMGQAMLTSPQTSLEEHETKEIVDDESKQQHPQQPQQQQQQPQIQTQDNVARKEEHFAESPSKPSLKPRPDASASHHRQAFDHGSNPKVAQSHAHANYSNPSPMSQQQQHLIQPPAIYQPPQAMYGMQMPGSVPFIQTVPTMQTMPSSTAQSSGEMSLLMSESKIHHGEIKSAVNRVTERIDDLMLKIDRLEKSGIRQEAPKPISGNEMEASTLAANISRIVQENEKLKTECVEKTKKIEILNEKISEMLLKNQNFLEKSNQLMEERADSIKSNTTQAMLKINTLEQENASLTTQLSTLNSQVSGFEAKVEEAKARESELKSKIRKLKEERDSITEQLESVSSSASDHKDELGKLQNSYKEEKQEKKKLKIKLEHMEEEIQEVKQEKESAVKALNDRKKKQQSDRKKFDEEIEELKNSHEEEIKSLKQLYKKSSLEAEKIAAVEKELQAKHQEHLKKVVQDTENRWEEKYQELLTESDRLKSEISLLNDKVKKMMILEEKNAELETLVEELQNAKNQTFLKANDEIEKLRRKVQNLHERNETIESEAFEKGLAKGKAEAAAKQEETDTQSSAADEVKKVMNGVFFKLKTEFQPDENYTGKDIIKEILETIREVTLKMTKGKETEEESEEEDEEEDEEDDEEVDDDDDDDDEDDGDDDEDDEDDDDGDDDDDDDGDDDEDEDDEEEEDKEEDEAGELQNDEENIKELARKSMGIEEQKGEVSVEENSENKEDFSGLEAEKKEENYVEKENNSIAVATEEVPSSIEDSSIIIEKDVADEEDGPGNKDMDADSKKDVERHLDKEEDIGSSEAVIEGQNNGAVVTENEEQDSAKSAQPNAVTMKDEDDQDSDSSDEDFVLANDENKSDSDRPANDKDLVTDETTENAAEGSIEHATEDTKVDFREGTKEDTKEDIREGTTEDAKEDIGEGTTEDTKEDIREGTTEGAKEDENESVGVKTEPSSAGNSVKNEDVKSSSLLKESPSKSLFDDEDDDADDFFLNSKSKGNSKKASSPSAFSRSPPPLFDDDDEDTNWI